MLKEQMINLAMKALSKVNETKEIMQSTILQDESVKKYLKSLQKAAKWLAEQDLDNNKPDKKTAKKSRKPVRPVKKTNIKPEIKINLESKERKSSIKPIKEINSTKADTILSLIKNNNLRIISKTDELNGKKSLAYLIWALGNAEKANISDGISVHDISSLLYKTSNIELYPINISRVLNSNMSFIKKAGQEKRTKTYLLSSQGKKVFEKKFSL